MVELGTVSRGLPTSSNQIVWFPVVFRVAVNVWAPASSGVKV